ncbi:MAG TPA: glycosyl amidation-associated protein WbuZ [Sulfurovum sp.]|nr:glycosyl amidation-associated protein WbuZ [Sulfurovum sp.]
MLQTRVIPVLLLQNKGLVKTVKFKNPKYVGDPLNAIKIFNEKEVDELIFLDIDASKKGMEPDYELIKDFASECFMPVCYGGGITNIEQIKKIFTLGIEKISINYFVLKNDELIKKAVEIYGSQSIVVAIDIKKSLMGKYQIYDHTKKKNLKTPFLEYIKHIEELGAGEILINNVDLDGTQKGYDIDLLKQVVNYVKIPVIACGGAGELKDFQTAKKEANVSAVSAGSFFVFQGKHNAVLITYPKYQELEKLFGET